MTSHSNGEPAEQISLVGRVASAKTPGSRLRIARECAGLSLGQAARLLGCPVPQVSGEELGEHALSEARIELLASYYGVNPRWVATGELASPGDIRGLEKLAPEARANVLALLRVIGSADACPWCARTHDGGPESCLVGVLLVCGGRGYNDRERVWQVLDRTAKRVEILAVRHGAAKGADALAGEWARDRGYVEQPRPADWSTHGRSAGPKRNASMLDEGGVVAVVAFPGGTGTEHMVTLARAAGLPVWDVKPRP